MRVSKRMPDKFIIGLVALAVLAVLSAVGVGLSVSSALALEQAPRCGMEEHVHTEECYVGDILVCGQKMHTHTENCYLVLLRDNDVNKLLTKVAQTSDNSLESLIRNTVVQAVVLSQGGQTAADGEEDEPEPSPTPSPTLDPSIIPSLTPSPSPSPTPLPEVDGEEEAQPITNEDIVQLNAVAAANDVQPRVLLNESLTIQTASEDSMTEEELLAALLSSSGSSSGGSSTYAVGQDPSTGSRAANFYIYIVDESGTGEWKCISNSTTYSNNQVYVNGTRSRYKVITKDTVLTAINNEIDDDFSNSSGYQLYYTESPPTDDSSWVAAVNATQYSGAVGYYGTEYNAFSTSANSSVSTPIYIRLYASGTSGTVSDSNAIQFFVLTYEGTTTDELIMRVGTEITVETPTEGYVWEDAQTGERYSGGEKISPDRSLTLKLVPDNYTLTYLKADSSPYTSESVVPGDTRTVIDPLEGYDAWVDASDDTTIYKAGATLKVDTDMTLKPVKLRTVTMIDADGGTTTAEVIDGKTYKVVSTDLIWTYEDDTELDTALGTDGILYATVTVNRDMTLTAHRARTITYTYQDSSIADKTVRVIDGSAYTVDAPASGYAWFTEAGVLFTDTEINPVTEDITLTGVRKYTVSVQQTPGGSYTDYTYYNGDTFTVPKPPAGYVWSDGTNTYTGGQTVTVSSDLTFTLQAEPDLTVTYNANWSTPSGYSDPDEIPTVLGSDSVVVSAGNSCVLNGVTDRSINYLINGATECHVTVYFTGWLTETNELIQPSVTLTWEELQAYDANGDGTVSLTGQWNNNWLQSVNFFVEYVAGTFNPENNKSYTPSIFTTYVGGIEDELSNGTTWLNNQHAINNGSTFTNEGEKTPLECDVKVRALYGNTAGDIWLGEFPSDSYIFEQLKVHAEGGELSVPIEGKEDENGNQVYETVQVDDLNEYGYAIRWYTFKIADDTWHIDGRLIRKVGKVHTTKTFAGNATLIEAAKNGFYITAVNKDESKHIIMTLEEASTTEQSRILAERGWDASIVTSWITPIDDGDGDPNTYLWEFDDIKYNEEWIITEYPPDLSDLAKYNEWIVVDSSALGQSNSGEGGTVEVKGVTQATDLEDPEWLRAEFNNIYYLSNSLMLKKEDGSTGLTLDGVQFRFYQDGYLITFDYDADKGLYVRNSYGTGAYDALTVGEGYANISLDGFSYDKGDIIIQEVSPPTGYELVGEVRVGYTGELDKDGNQIVGITNSADYAQYHDGLVVIQNNPSLRDVTVTKTWNCAESEKGDVVVQLLANGDVGLTARILAGRKDAGGNAIPATVTIKEAGGWTYTWENMPLYANGEKVEYSIREIKIGGESCKSDYTFSNWLVVYKAPVTDAAGNITLGVENITPSRPILYLNKIDMLGRPLAGAVFELVEVDTDGSVKADAIPKTATTADDGSLNFDNLSYDTIYRLRELTAPDGYWAYTDPAYISIAIGGKVTIGTEVSGGVIAGTHTYVKDAATTFTVDVTNRSADKLPETGGGGTNGYYATGVMLILLALCVTILPQIRKRGRYRMRR